MLGGMLYHLSDNGESIKRTDPVRISIRDLVGFPFVIPPPGGGGSFHPASNLFIDVDYVPGSVAMVPCKDRFSFHKE